MVHPLDIEYAILNRIVPEGRTLEEYHRFRSAVFNNEVREQVNLLIEIVTERVASSE